MAVDQLDLMKNQAKAVLRNKVSGSAAKLRAQTSLVGQASRLTGRMTRQLEQAEQAAGQALSHGRIHPEHQIVAEKAAAVKPAPDGYVRRSPVQPVHVPADYHKRIFRKVLGGVLVAVCVVAAIWLLMETGFLTN